MWLLFALCFMLWLVAVEFTLPAAVILVTFAATLTAAGYAFVPARRAHSEPPAFDPKRLYTRW